MKNKKTLFIALSVVLALSIAYAAIAGVLTIEGNGTLGDVVSLEFTPANGVAVLQEDIAITDTEDTGFALLPSQISVDGDTITFTDINFPDPDPDAVVSFLADFLLYNSGGTDATVSAAVTNIEVTLDDGVTVIRNLAGETSSTNPQLSGINVLTYLNFVGNYGTIIEGDIDAGVANAFNFGVNLAQDADTTFGVATAAVGEFTLAGASFTFSITFDYEANTA